MAPPTAPPTPTPATTRVKQSFLAILLLLPRPHLSSPPHALASTPALLILLHQKTMGSAFFLQRRGRKWNPQIASQTENRERPNAPQTHSSKCLRHKGTRQRWIAREQQRWRWCPNLSLQQRRKTWSVCISNVDGWNTTQSQQWR